MRANLDGSNIETLVDSSKGDARPGTDLTKWCVGITVDPDRGQIYWTQKGPDDAGKGRIFRANIATPKGETHANSGERGCGAHRLGRRRTPASGARGEDTVRSKHQREGNRLLSPFGGRVRARRCRGAVRRDQVRRQPLLRPRQRGRPGGELGQGSASRDALNQFAPALEQAEHAALHRQPVERGVPRAPCELLAFDLPGRSRIEHQQVGRRSGL